MTSNSSYLAGCNGQPLAMLSICKTKELFHYSLFVMYKATLANYIISIIFWLHFISTDRQTNLHIIWFRLVHP